MKAFLYDRPILPNDFKFPREYLDLVLADEVLDMEPWQFLSKDMAASLYYYSSMLIKFPEAALVPFAIIKDESGLYNDGWVVLACFDAGGEERSPCVRIYDYSRPKLSPWDNLAYSSFSEWFDAAQVESVCYKAERPEDKGVY